MAESSGSTRMASSRTFECSTTPRPTAYLEEKFNALKAKTALEVEPGLYKYHSLGDVVSRDRDVLCGRGHPGFERAAVWWHVVPGF